MKTQEIMKQFASDKYNFLRDVPLLGNNIAMLVLGGSYSYGLNTDNSDIDLRGVYLNSASDILLNKQTTQYESGSTDTVIYSSNGFINLLKRNNTNILEMLGCLPEHYIYLSKVGKLLLDNADLFISKICIYTFGAYASQLLHKIERAGDGNNTTDINSQILNSIDEGRYSFIERYAELNKSNGDAINLYTDNASYECGDNIKEIYADISLTHYPLKDYCGMISDMQSIVNGYAKRSKRNERAIKHSILGKHMSHLIRLYLTCIDILETGKIITYRKEHDLLMDLRCGKYLTADMKPTQDFYDIFNEYKARFDKAKKDTSIPDKPNYKAIDKLQEHINRDIITNDICNMGW